MVLRTGDERANREEEVGKLGEGTEGGSFPGALAMDHQGGGGQGAAEVAREVVQEAVGSPVAACCHCKPTYV